MTTTDTPSTALRRGRAALHGLAASCTKALGGVATASRAPLVLATVLAAVLGWQLGTLTWLVMPDPAATDAPASAGVVSPAGASRPSNGGQDETRRMAGRLFGERTDTAGDARDLPEKAPETQLNLTLRGVLTAGEGQGFAFIVASGTGETVYTPGEMLPGNARLERVYQDRVLLSRDGSLETLWLDRAGAAAAAARTPSRRQGDGATAEFDRERAADTARELRARLREQPSELMRVVRFDPYEQNGKLQGFRVQPSGEARALLRGLGLTRNDVLTAINGIPLDDRSRLGEVVQALRTAGEARVQFLRDGEQRSITIPIAEGE